MCVFFFLFFLTSKIKLQQNCRYATEKIALRLRINSAVGLSCQQENVISSGGNSAHPLLGCNEWQVQMRGSCIVNVCENRALRNASVHNSIYVRDECHAMILVF